MSRWIKRSGSCLKGSLCVLLLFVMWFGVSKEVQAAEEPIEGTDYTWEIDSTTKELTILGNGSVKEPVFTKKAKAPWSGKDFTSIEFSNVNAKNISYWFYGCDSLVDLSSLTIPDTVTDMTGTFEKCTKLQVSPKLPANLVYLDNTFKECTSLKSVPNIPGKVKEMDYAFWGCSALETQSTFEFFATPSSIVNAFPKGIEIDVLTNPTMDNKSYVNKLSDTFRWKGVEGKGWSLSELGNLSITKGGTYDALNIPWGTYREDIKVATITDTEITNLDYWFYNCTGLISVTGIPLDKVTSMKKTFWGCVAFEGNLTLPDNLENLDYTFYNCRKLETMPSIPLKVTSMNNTFAGCVRLKAISLLPESVTSMVGTFRGCTGLEAVDLTIPSQVTDMRNLFLGCSNLSGKLTILTSVIGNGKAEKCFLNATTKPSVSLMLYGNPTVGKENFDFVEKLVTEAKNPQIVFAGRAGKFGGAGEWRIETSSGTTTLQLTGSPETAYTESKQVPWYFYRDKIQAVTLNFDNGATMTNMNYWFSGCTELTTVTTATALPASITSMTCTFMDCTALTTIPTLPTNLTSMDQTFMNCKALITILELPTNLTSMNQTFMGCEALTTIPTLPTSITSMIYTFSKCTSLITPPALPSELLSMNGIFEGCTSMTGVPIIPEKVESMKEAFSGCSKLDGTIQILASPTQTENWIGMGTHEGTVYVYGNPSVDNLDIVDKMVTDRNSANIIFKGIEGTFLNGGIWNIVKEGARDVKLTLSGTPTTSYTDAESFEWAKYQERIVIADASGVDAIVTNMDYWFAECKNLREVLGLPTGITTMDSTFQRCRSLEKIPNLPVSVTSMDSTFYGCWSLGKIPNLPVGVTIMNSTFYECTSLKEIPGLPIGVTTMNSTFQGCISLKKMPVLPTGVTSMNSTFEDCAELGERDVVDVEIPATVTDITRLFWGCTNLNGKLTILPENVISTDCLKNATNRSEILEVYANPTVDNFALVEGIVTEAANPNIIFKGVGGEFGTGGQWTITGTGASLKLTLSGKPTVGIANADSIPWKAYITKIAVADASGIDKSNPVYMDYWFAGTNITTIPTDMPQKVNSMEGTFQNCVVLGSEATGISFAIPASVTNIKSLFSGCSALTGDITICPDETKMPIEQTTGCFKDVTAKPVNVYGNVHGNVEAGMPDNGTFVESIVTAETAVDSRTNIKYMGLTGVFGGNGVWRLEESGTKLILSGTPETGYKSVDEVPWKSYVSTITTVDVAGLITSTGKINNMDYWFMGMEKLTDISDLIRIEGVTSMNYTFRDCSGLGAQQIVLGKNLKSIKYLFAGCDSLSGRIDIKFSGKVDVFNWLWRTNSASGIEALKVCGDANIPGHDDYVQNEVLNGMMAGQISYGGIFGGIVEEGLTPSVYWSLDGNRNLGFYTDPVITKDVTVTKRFSAKVSVPWHSYRDRIKGATYGGNVLVENMDYWFADCINLKTAPELPNGLKTMSDTFRECTGLTDVSTMKIPDTVISMNHTFVNCTNLIKVPTLPSKLECMTFTFGYCNSLTTVENMDIPATVTSMDGTFSNCVNLRLDNSGSKSIQLPSGLKSMQGIFRYCTSLDYFPQIPSNVEDIHSAYSGAKASNVSLTIPETVLECESVFEKTVFEGNSTIVLKNWRTSKPETCFKDIMGRPLLECGATQASSVEVHALGRTMVVGSNNDVVWSCSELYHPKP